MAKRLKATPIVQAVGIRYAVAVDNAAKLKLRLGDLRACGLAALIFEDHPIAST